MFLSFARNKKHSDLIPTVNIFYKLTHFFREYRQATVERSDKGKYLQIKHYLSLDKYR